MEHDSLLNILRDRFARAVAQVAGMPLAEVDPMVRPAQDPRFGDYQCNVAMSLAKPLKAKPRDVAERIKAAVEPALAGMAEPLEIAGPGFINVRLRDECLACCLEGIPAPGDAVDRFGLPPVEQPRRVVVEYSQPNIAKQMHVGHLRSTIIGDVFARVLAFEGHEVVRQNHIGDWGTQFGMLIRWYREHPLPTPATHADVLEAIEGDYKAANERFKSDEQFASEARLAVTELQSGDAEARRVWEAICAQSRAAFTEIYERLNVLLAPEDVCGESFYNDRLPGIIRELREKLAGPGGAEDTAQEQWHTERDTAQGHTGGARAVVRDHEGAVVVYLYDEKGQPQFKNAEGEILGMIVRKSDGAFLYATTDLAAIRYRLKELKFSSGVGAERIVYVTDARQKLHFEMFFATARAMGWMTDQQVEHVTFGSVLGGDRRPLKTRTGGTVKLRELLDEAEKRAYELLEARDAEAVNQGDDDTAATRFSADERREIAQCVGIAAVKYADLRQDRTSDYVFDWDKMLALQGNTAPYMMYAYARIRSIYRKAAERFGSPDVYAAGVGLHISEPTERALALRLARLRETIDAVAADLAPHVLCAYLYDLAGDFMRFYEACPVLQAPDEAVRLGRMRLCDLTARALRLGLGLLGIETIERM
ncbi:MAG: arginine--tRNA ligase [Phycisphaerae bacterium]|jgi:arginyl-tRNA synthetase